MNSKNTPVNRTCVYVPAVEKSQPSLVASSPNKSNSNNRITAAAAAYFNNGLDTHSFIVLLRSSVIFPGAIRCDLCSGDSSHRRRLAMSVLAQPKHSQRSSDVSDDGGGCTNNEMITAEITK